MDLKQHLSRAAGSTGAAFCIRPAADSSALPWALSGPRTARSRTHIYGPHFTPKAKSVIFLFMCGGVSHIDTFDPKDNKWAGKLIDAVGFGDNVAEMKRPVIPCLRTFTRYGKSGIPVSDWFPHVGGVIDEIAVVRSMWCNEGNHFPGRDRNQHRAPRPPVRSPDAGRWVTYALGSANKNLPTFVNIGRPSSPVQLTGGYLGATVAATPFQPGDTPIPNLYPPKTEQRRRARAADAGAPGPEPGVPRPLRASTPTSPPGRKPTSWPRGCSSPRPTSSISPRSRST